MISRRNLLASALALPVVKVLPAPKVSKMIGSRISMINGSTIYWDGEPMKAGDIIQGSFYSITLNDDGNWHAQPSP